MNEWDDYNDYSNREHLIYDDVYNMKHSVLNIIEILEKIYNGDLKSHNVNSKLLGYLNQLYYTCKSFCEYYVKQGYREFN